MKQAVKMLVWKTSVESYPSIDMINVKAENV
jgi:hypothetical protein